MSTCGLSPYAFSIKTLYEFLFSPMCDMCLIYLILLDLITQIISLQEHKSISVSSICYILPLMLKYLHLDTPIKYPTDDLDCKCLPSN